MIRCYKKLAWMSTGQVHLITDFVFGKFFKVVVAKLAKDMGV